MKNKLFIFYISFITVVFLGVSFLISQNFFQEYERNYNVVVSNIVEEVVNKYPDVKEEDIVKILNDEKVSAKNLNKYGIYLDKDSLSVSNKKIKKRFIVTEIIVVLIFILFLFFLFSSEKKKRDRELEKLIYYVEEINKKNYKLDLLSNKEDNISILQNEIYKTMVMLKESAENSLIDKKKLKDSLSDISHQLKTPLTSILIMLDNLIEDSEMDETTRLDFLNSIKRDIFNINFLVQSILKLSSIETNSLVFKRTDINVYKLLKEVIDNVEIMRDIKNIKIYLKCHKTLTFKGDFKWEVEALTNILKNAIEHSYNDSTIDITVLDNKTFLGISIKDEGEGMSEYTLKHLFERFYKASDNDSGFGIGLSLAKRIIEEDNGFIKVSSRLNEGTVFNISYRKY